MNEVTARKLLMRKVRSHPFLSKKAVRKMELTCIDKKSIYIYELCSLCEKRKVGWRAEPHQANGTSSLSKEIPVAFQSRRLSLGSDSRSSSITVEPPEALRQNGTINRNYWPGLIKRKTSERRLRSSSTSQSNSTLVMEEVCNIPKRKHSSSSLDDISRKTIYQRVDTGILNSIQGEKDLSFNDSQKSNSDLIWSLKSTRQNRKESDTNHESIELPGSSFVKTCDGCKGKGHLRCKPCRGEGQVPCSSCNGQGNLRILSSWSRTNRASEQIDDKQSIYGAQTENNLGFIQTEQSISLFEQRRRNRSISNNSISLSSPWLSESCHSCHGGGQQRCLDCSGRSSVSCKPCNGTGSLRCFLNLDIIRCKHFDFKTINNNDGDQTLLIPENKLRSSSGTVIADFCGAQLAPMFDGRINESMDEETSEKIKEISRKLLKKHDRVHTDELIIEQRHKLIQFECFVVTYSYKNKIKTFIIYGKEQRVQLSDFPFRSICNIF